jgi:hypothetical protein
MTIADLTREEAFDAICNVMTGLHLAGALSLEQRRALDTLICAYGAAAAREARERSLAAARAAVRPGVPLVRRIDGVEWLE